MAQCWIGHVGIPQAHIVPFLVKGGWGRRWFRNDQIWPPFRYHYPPRRYNNTRVAKYRKLSFWKLNVHTEKVHVRLPGSRRHTTREYRSVQENGGLLNQAQSCIGMQRWKKYYDCVVGRFKQRRLESAVAAISSCQKNCVIMPNGDLPNEMFFSIVY